MEQTLKVLKNKEIARTQQRQKHFMGPKLKTLQAIKKSRPPMPLPSNGEGQIK